MDISKYKPNGTFWSCHEDEQLNKMYNEQLMDITEISNIINRTPGSIISRLCKNKYIPNRTSSRGYNNYKNSELYKSIVTSGEGKKTSNQKNKLNEHISININGMNSCEYIELKNDVKEIKNSVKELLEIMRAVYEFEEA
jgi:hypothetical protein